ncbi:MAG: VWA domain-containing protein [Acidiferrobacterales bacterium]
MSNDETKLKKTSKNSEITEFLQKVAQTPAVKPAGERGRLVFAMDATASREPTWDTACHIQGQMFQETAALGGLDIQLCYYRGLGEFNASPWLSNSASLLPRMTSVFCLGGHTQIEKVLRHTIAQTRKRRVNAVVFVGDCMEEDVDRLCHLAGELGLLGVPAFIFHEGVDATAERAFKQIARLTRGAYCRLDASSAQQLRDLLSAVAVYAVGGHRALEDFGKRRGGVVLQLTRQVKKG